MLHLRIVTPPDRTGRVREILCEDPAVWNVIVLAGAAVRPAGDVVLADVAREDASVILTRLIVDPMCGIGTTIAEAVRLDRDAFGVELETRWADLASANVAHARSEGAPGRACVLTGDARELPRLLSSKAARSLRESASSQLARLPYATADLVLTSPPYGCEVGDVDRSAWHTGRRICPDDSRNYSTDKSNIGHARGRSYAAAMIDIYRACGDHEAGRLRRCRDEEHPLARRHAQPRGRDDRVVPGSGTRLLAARRRAARDGARR